MWDITPSTSRCDAVSWPGICGHSGRGSGGGVRGVPGPADNAEYFRFAEVHMESLRKAVTLRIDGGGRSCWRGGWCLCDG
jgi:hypothetical protein